MSTTYIRKPFFIKAFQLTEENLAEFGPVNKNQAGQRYVKIRNAKGYPGDWVTKRFDKFQLFHQKAFDLRFVECTDELFEVLQSHGVLDAVTKADAPPVD